MEQEDQEVYNGQSAEEQKLAQEILDQLQNLFEVPENFTVTDENIKAVMSNYVQTLHELQDVEIYDRYISSTAAVIDVEYAEALVTINIRFLNNRFNVQCDMILKD